MAWGSARVRKLAGGAIVGVAVGLLTGFVACGRPLMFERGEWWTHDVRARSSARAADASKDILIVDVSEQDIEDAENNLGVTWPWPRALYGYITGYLHKAGAKAVVFDWLFQDRGQYSVRDAEEFATAMRDAKNVVIGLALTRHALVQRSSDGRWAAKLGTYKTRKQAVAVAMQLMAWNTRTYLVGDGPTTVYYGGKSKAKEVVAAWMRMSGAEELSELFSPPPADGGDPPPPQEPKPRELTDAEVAGLFTIETVIAERDGMVLADPSGISLPVFKGMDPPLAVIAAGPARTGNVYQEFEADGIMRRHTPLVRYGERLYPSLALAAYLVGNPGTEVAFTGQTLKLGKRRVPLDPDGKIPIRFHGKEVYPHVAAYSILQSQALLDEGKKPVVDPATLKGKYVIISASGQALRDIRVTPVAQTQQGAEIQANALDNLLAGNVIERTSPGLDAFAAFLLCIIVAVAVVALWTMIPKAGVALLVTGGAMLLLLAGYWFLASWLYTAKGVWLAVATPAIGAGISAFVALLVTSASERRGRRFVQEALGRYTSRELVRELTANPEKLELGWGEKLEMSVYFSDIAGFTTISEGLDPEKLVSLLNAYLTSMSDLVLAHNGQIDKYIGDAVMAYWGAPLPNPNHARDAVLCALAMRKKCDEMRPVWEAEYGKILTARAGVNSGLAVAGNMGSAHRIDYTIMGDMVNLAARLEGANKPYGTELMISEFTLAKVKNDVEVRELDFLAVKGKEQPVRVYEVLDEKGAVPDDVTEAMAVYHEGLALYQGREFAAAIPKFKQALELHPGDGPSEMYIRRCEHFVEQPPEESWDGVWRMKEK